MERARIVWCREADAHHPWSHCHAAAPGPSVRGETERRGLPSLQDSRLTDALRLAFPGQRGYHDGATLQKGLDGSQDCRLACLVCLVAIYYAPGLTKSGLGESGAFLTVLTVLVGFHVAVHLGMQTLAMISTKPLDALILATVDEPKQDSPAPTLGASCGTSSAQASQDGGSGADEAKEDGATGDAEPASKETGEDSGARERKSEEEADGSAEAAVAGGAAGADPAATTPPHAPAQTDAVTTSASQTHEPASSTLDTVRVVILVLYSLIMLGGVTALVWIVFDP